MPSATRCSTQTPPMCQLVVLLIVIYSSGINCFQRFSEQPKYTEVNPGQDALLTCKVIDKRGTCSWQKDNKPVGIYAKKYEWAARPSSGNGGLHLDLHPPPMQIGGDCSLWIRSATLDFDDGFWECQVTASDFTTQDALTSQPVRLVVRVAPQRPRLEYEGAHVPPGHNITVESGAVATVKCVSHYGNPPATLRWYLGDQEIPPLHPQVNLTEPDNSRTWSASSVVQVPAMRERHGDMLRCLAFHESYSAKSVPVEARLDIKYAPTIRLIGSPEIDLEEDKDALILRCVADANPPASIVWRRAGRSEISSLQETLQLRPVGRRDAGLYTCQAQNSVGTSEQLSVQLDVKYPPKILSAGPDRLTTAPLFSPAAFECVAEGNPMPSYKWVQRISHGSKYVERGSEARLVIDNVTYDYQGEYECRATSYINGQERVAISEPISLQVVGAPQVLRLHPSMHTVSVKRGDPASLSLVVCADPRPHRVAWEWGSLRLEAGSGIDRFRVDDVVQDAREDCYLSTLHIQRSEEHDSRPYYLAVENERGTDRHAIHLSVEEPLEMSYLLGIAGGCLAAVLILICLCIYAVRSKKCCFKGSSGYKSSDKDSEKADLKSRSDSTSGPQGDSIYTTPAGFHQQHHAHHQHAGHGSPEAMKQSVSAADLATTSRGNIIWRQDSNSLVEQEDHRRLQQQQKQQQHIFDYQLQQQHHQQHQQQHQLQHDNVLQHQNPLQQQNSLQQQNPLQHQSPLRPSTSFAVLAKNEDPFLSLKRRASGGELLTTHQRHQRDLFSGDLGIPEVNTHVGSVVNTFETMAMLRRQAEQQQQANLETQEHQQRQQQQQQQQHFSKYDNPATTELCAQRQQRPQLTEPEPPAAPTCYGATNKKYHQLKRKSHKSRQKLLQLSKQQLLKLSHKPHLLPAAKKAISCSTQTTPHSNISYNWRSPLLQQQQHQQQQQQSATAAEIFADQHYQHIRDDYRKNLFGTIKLQHPSCSPPSSSHRGCSHQNRVQQPVVTVADDSNITGVKSDSNDCLQSISCSAAEDEVSFIVNEAFDEIFADYSCADDDDENGVPPEGAAIRNVGDRSEPDGKPEDVMICKPVRRTTTTLASNEFGRAERAPKRLLSAHKKAAPAPPSPSHLVATNTSSQSNLKQPMLKQQKRRASKLSRFLEGIKHLPRSKHAAFYKIPADSLLRDDLHAEAQVQVPSSVLLRHSQQPRLGHRNSAHAEAGGLPSVADDSHLLRGTTLSQSFVRQLRKRCSKERRPEKRSSKKTAAPPVPTAVTKSAPTKPASPPDANRQRGPQVMLFPKQRLKSSTDLLLDELISTQRQRYCRKNDHNFVDASGGDGSGESRRNDDAEGDKKNLMSFKPHDDYVSAEI